jgi:hypothetical protein
MKQVTNTTTVHLHLNAKGLRFVAIRTIGELVALCNKDIFTDDDGNFTDLNNNELMTLEEYEQGTAILRWDGRYDTDYIKTINQLTDIDIAAINESACDGDYDAVDVMQFINNN